MRTKPITFSLILVLASVLSAQTKPALLEKIYVGKDGLVHLIDVAGKDVTMPKEKGQVEVSAPKLAEDKLSAGWLVHEDNCCTSYSIPTSLIIFRRDAKRTIGDGLMIYDWCFVDRGEKVAMSTGTVHGMQSRHLLLYNAQSGRQLEEWNGDFEAIPPTWAKDLSQ